MDVLFEASFAKDLKRIRDKQLLRRVQKIIEEIKTADNPTSLRNLKKIVGHSTFYRNFPK